MDDIQTHSFARGDGTGPSPPTDVLALEVVQAGPSQTVGAPGPPTEVRGHSEQCHQARSSFPHLRLLFEDTKKKTTKAWLMGVTRPEEME